MHDSPYTAGVYKRFFIIFFFFSFFPAALIPAQDDERDESPGWVPLTKEDVPHADDSVNLRYILEYQASSHDPADKMTALDSIEQLIDDGIMTKEDTQTIAILESIALEGITSQTRMGGHEVSGFPLARMGACRLLGKLGGSAAEGTLKKVLQNEREAMVLSEAFFALAHIITAPGPDTLSLLSSVIRRQHLVNPDNNFAFTAVSAVEKLNDKTDGLTDPELFRSIILLTGGEYMLNVREKALALLKKMRRNTD